MQETKKYTPPDAVLKNMRRGRSIAVMKNRKPTIDKVSTEFSLNEIKELYTKQTKFIGKSINPLARLADGGPSDGFLEFLTTGGKAGLAWTRKVLKENGVLKSYGDTITEAELNTEEKVVGFDLPIEKQHNDELMQVTYVAMLPDSTDLTGDYTSAEDVRKAMESFNKSAMRANLFHRVMTDKFHVVESYLAPTDFVLNEIPVAKGTWLMTFQINDENIWKMIKSGDITGISIGARATVETLEEDND
jgi:hypothetical protein